MLFNSFEFIFLFLPVTIIFFYLNKNNTKLSIIWLSFTSLAFYTYWNIAFLPLLLGSIIFNFIFGKIIVALSKRKDAKLSKIALMIGIGSNLLLLAYFKYMDFFIDVFNQLTHSEHPFLNLILPLGISFFSFTQIAYLVDCFRDKANENSFLKYLLFVSYFPHLIAGPILHHKEMIPQFNNVNFFKKHFNLAAGLTMFTIGLFKKLFLADGISDIADIMFTTIHTSPLTMLNAWIGALAYTMQIYFDFSGYSDMAIGLSFLFGIYLPINFNSPYQASSIIEFWRRWHMTLSRFLRDYLYFPLGGNRKGSVRKHVNLLITMLLGGLWHGAGWTFIVWGGLHGSYLIINHGWRNLYPKLGLKLSTPFYGLLSSLLTFLCVVIAWVFFRSPDMQTATAYLQAMLGLQNAAANPSITPLYLHDKLFLIVLLGIAFFFPNSLEIMNKVNLALSDENLSKNNKDMWYHWKLSSQWGLMTGLVFSTLLIGILCIGDGAQFLYFQF